MRVAIFRRQVAVLVAVALALGSALATLAAAGCGGASKPAAEPGIADGDPDFVISSGEVTFARDKGTLVLRLPENSCTRSRVIRSTYGDVSRIETPCPAFPHTGWQAASLLPPWGVKITPFQGGAGGVAFRIDWRAAHIDPLAPGAIARLQKPWRIESPDAYEPAEWTPDESDLAAMLVLIGEATDTQIEVEPVSAPPQIEVVAMRMVDGLRNGASGVMEVTVRNKGVGAAYRLVAMTSSNIDALHKRQISFGRLLPGESKTRRLVLELPRGNLEPYAVMVLIFNEAHRFAPAQVSANFPVQPAVDVALLGLDCRFLDLPAEGTEHPRVDAGQTLNLSCEVRNDGAPIENLRVIVSIEGHDVRVGSSSFDVPTGKAQKVLLAVDVPQDATIDSELAVKIETSGGKDVAIARSRLVVVVARPRLCPEGKLSTEEFTRKRDGLRRKLDAGLITKAEFLQYEQDLVACRK